MTTEAIEAELIETATHERRRRLLSHVEFKFVKYGRKGERNTRVHVQDSSSERPLVNGALLAYKALSMMFFIAEEGASDKASMAYALDETPLYLDEWNLTRYVTPAQFRYAEQFLRAGLRAARKALEQPLAEAA